MAKYVLTRAILGGEKPLKAGDLIELTDEQAAHPLYAHRVTPANVPEQQEEPAKGKK